MHGRSYGRLASFAVALLLVVGPPEAVALDAGRHAGALTGHWTDLTHPSEGFTIEILEDQRGLASWLAYDFEGHQAWIVGAGPLIGNRLVIDQAVITNGGVFGAIQPPEALERSIWGRMEFTFEDCNHALFEYEGPPEYGSGTQNLVRLSAIDGRQCDQQRGFRLGFTPFPPDLGQEGAEVLIETYARIRDYGDIVGHHFDDGIPWPEAAAGGGVESYHPNLRADWEFRRAMTPAGHQVYLALTPISIARDALAPYRGADSDTPLGELGPPWDAIAFDDPLVKQAFLQHAINAVEFFRPDYLAIGIEVNLLIDLAPGKWSGFLELHRETYEALRQRYRSLPIFVTMTAGELLPGLTGADPDRQQQALTEMLPLTDMLGISFYPFLTALGTEPLPEDLFGRIDALSDKPIAIAETGFPAQFQQLSIVLPGDNVDLTLDGTEEKQLEYFQRLLEAAERHQFRFVINFVSQDYDLLCGAINCSDFNRLWRDTGLWDEAGRERTALLFWREHLERQLRK